MKSSETVNELAQALAKAQAQMKPAVKDAENPFFKSNYADLASVWEACRLPLSQNGLSVVQTTRMDEQGRLVLDTILLHSSGQWVEGTLPILSARQDMQSIGAALTYAKRQGLKAIAGIADDEDDDGETAVGRGTFAPVAVPKPQAVEEKKFPPASAKKLVSEAQLKRLFAIVKHSDWSNSDVSAYIKLKFGIESSKELNQVQYEQLVNDIEKGSPQIPEAPENEDSLNFSDSPA
jgi:hypothetical protein